jgi:DNA repair photolyase
MIERDIDLLARGDDGDVFFGATLDNRSARMGRARPPQAPGHAAPAMPVPVGVLLAPVIPMLTDCEIEHILEAAQASGARAAGYVLLRLPHELKQVWREWLELHYPQRAAHVMSLVQQMRGGKDYDSAFGTRMRGEGPFAQLIAQRLPAHRRRGWAFTALDSSKFVAPQGVVQAIFSDTHRW